MFWKSNTTTAKQLVEIIPTSIERPKPRLIVDNKSLDSEYEQLAEDLGLHSAAVIEAKIVKVLARNKISTYDLTSVLKYLASQAEPCGKFVIWRPLRERDKPKGWCWRGSIPHSKIIDKFHGAYGQNFPDWVFRPYDKAVPLRILRDVKKIQDAVPESLFFVSDYAVPSPDPFIMVTVLDAAKIVFGVWDEPGFIG